MQTHGEGGKVTTGQTATRAWVLALLALGYAAYGRWVARQFALDDARLAGGDGESEIVEQDHLLPLPGHRPEQPDRVRMPRRPEHGTHVRDLHDAAGIHDGDAIGELADFVGDARLALDQTDDALRATANPIELVEAPLNQLGTRELCPGAVALERINASLR